MEGVSVTPSLPHRVSIGGPKVPQETTRGPAVGPLKPALALDKVEEHQTVEEEVGIIPRPFRLLLGVSLTQVLLHPMEGLAVILEEAFGNALDVEGLPMKLPDGFRIGPRFDPDAREDLQVGAVRFGRPHLQEAQPEANPGGVFLSRKSEWRDKGDLFPKLPCRENEKAVSLRLSPVEGFQDAADVGPPQAIRGDFYVVDSEGRRSRNLGQEPEVLDQAPHALGEIADIPGNRWVLRRIAQMLEKADGTVRGKVLCQSLLQILHAGAPFTTH